MENQIDTHHIQEHLKDVCADPLFAHSVRYIEILKYLVEQALAGNTVKAHTIGDEVFGKNYNPNKDDGKVRVYMYNLRKKLQTYYATNGKDATLCFGFEKGSYDIKFLPLSNESESSLSPSTNSSNQKRVAIISVAAILLLGLVLYPFLWKKELYCWETLIDKDATNTCIFADQVILNKKGEKPGVLHTIHEVNSASDFIQYSKNNEADSLSLAEYTMNTRAIPYALIDITKLFFSNKANIQVLPESEFRYEKTKSSNIIYIGQYKTMSLSKEIFLSNSKIFKAYFTHFSSSKEGEETPYRPVFKGDLRAEYAMVSYLPLNDGNKALYFVSNHDIGTMATVHKFTDLNYLKEFYQKLPTKDAYFNALFKVDGLERTDVSCELVELEVVE